MPMGDFSFRTIAAQEPRLAPYAASPLPAWLWSADGERVLWGNPAGAAALGVDDPTQLERPRSPADSHRRQVSQLAGRLSRDGATRMERLRGFGARLGQLMTCACSRFELQGGESAILIIAMESPARPVRPAAAAPPPSAAVSTAAAAPPVAEAVAPAPSNPAPPAHVSADPPATDDAAPSPDAPPGDAPPPVEDASAEPVRTPVRFVWQIDGAGGFTMLTDGFVHVAGERTASLLGRPWIEIAQALDLDPRGRIAQAIANRETFSGLAAAWPLAGEAVRATIEMSGMPIYDGSRNFSGYRGFGIYRRLALHDGELTDERPIAAAPVEQPDEFPSHDPDFGAAAFASAAPDSPSLVETETVEPPKDVEPPQNVVPFPLTNDTRTPSLSVHENHAFDEIARRLTQTRHDIDARLQDRAAADHDAHDQPRDVVQEEPAREEQPAWLAAAAAPPRGDSARDRMLLDLMPSGILIYRLDRLLYANHAFLAATGFDHLHALQEAGGLDALYVEPGSHGASSASSEGMPLKITPPTGDATPADARLYSILWDGDSAHALLLQGPHVPAAAAAAAPPRPSAVARSPRPDTTLENFVEAVSDGVVLFDRSGEILSCNRNAEPLFGVGPSDLHRFNFADLFTDESQRIVLDSFEELDRSGAASLRGAALVFARARSGLVPLSMTMGRSGDDRFFAVFRDATPAKPTAVEPVAPQRTSAARTEELAELSHEIRGPLNTIAGAANVMIDERFGAVGNERYAAYLKDIRASAERALAILDGIANISNIESGRHELKLTGQNLNEMVEQCVGVLQPQANRERVIIRTSLAHALPQVIADTQALRQITMNIVTSSIRSSKGGGQVIVSTAPGENGGAVLRVRDSGRGMGDASASDTPMQRIGGSERGAVDLSLARALAEANRAQFQVRTTENAGTLIEVTFASIRALAG